MEGWAIALILIAVLIAIALLYFIVKKILERRKAAAMREIAIRKRTERNAVIAQIKFPTITISESQIQTILNSSVTALRAQLLQGTVTSEQLLTIFMKRATTIGVELECLAEVNWTESLELARKADEIYKHDPQRAKSMSLLGIPISIKDNFNMKGFDTTVGCASRSINPAHHDGLIIKNLKAEGAIPFIRSSMPQVGLINNFYKNKCIYLF